MDVQRILMRGHKSPFRVASATETLADNLIGNNVGNLVFAQAAYRLLDTSQGRVDVRKFSEFVADEVNESYDVLVVPLANAFRPSFVAELRRMTRVIRRLTIPVVVLGVGAQSNLGKGNAPGEDMAPDVKDFVSAVLDRSASMGVRGESTAEYLAGLGFGADVIDVIGCPSMFMNGPELTIDKLPGGIDRRAPISFNVSPYLHRIGPLSLQFAEQYPNLMYAAQDHLTLGLMLHGKYKAKSAPPAGTPTTLDHPLIAQNRVRFCLDPRTWMQYLSGFDFSVGTRIHGNITALLAGVPALVLAHDSRTLELARYHEIPHRLLRDRTVERADLVRWYSTADWRPTVHGHEERWQRLQQFLARNGLVHAFAEGEDPDEFNRRLAAVDFPRPVQMGGIVDWAAEFSDRRECTSLRRQVVKLNGELAESRAREFAWRRLPRQVARRLARFVPGRR